MTILDIILIVIFIASALTGFRKGFIRQLGSLAAIVIAIMACRLLGPTVTDAIGGSDPDWQATAISRATVSIIANALIYLVAYYGVVLIANVLHKVSHIILISPLDHIAGAAFSVAKYFLLVSLLLNLYIVMFPDTSLRSKSHLCGGRVVEMTAGFAPWVLDAISPLASGSDHDCTGPESSAEAPQPTEITI